MKLLDITTIVSKGSYVSVGHVGVPNRLPNTFARQRYRRFDFERFCLNTRRFSSVSLLEPTFQILAKQRFPHYLFTGYPLRCY